MFLSPAVRLPCTLEAIAIRLEAIAIWSFKHISFSLALFQATSVENNVFLAAEGGHIEAQQMELSKADTGRISCAQHRRPWQSTTETWVMTSNLFLSRS